MNARTTRAGLGLIAIGGLFGAALLHAPNANATPRSYLYALGAAGYPTDDTTVALGAGYEACDILTNTLAITLSPGAAITAVLDAWQRATFTEAEAIELTAMAVVHLCPEHNATIDDAAAGNPGTLPTAGIDQPQLQRAV